MQGNSDAFASSVRARRPFSRRTRFLAVKALAVATLPGLLAVPLAGEGATAITAPPFEGAAATEALLGAPTRGGLASPLSAADARLRAPAHDEEPVLEPVREPMLEPESTSSVQATTETSESGGTVGAASVAGPIDPASVTTLAGSGIDGTLDGPAQTAQIAGIGGGAVVGGFVYLGSSGTIRKVSTSTGAVTTLVGSASDVSCRDSTKLSTVRLGRIRSVATDGVNLYTLADCGGLRKTVIATGATSTIATISGANYVHYVAPYLYVTANQEVKRVTVTGTVTAFATLGGTGYALTADGSALWVMVSSIYIETMIQRVDLATRVVTTLTRDGLMGYSAITYFGGWLYVVAYTRLRAVDTTTGAGRYVAGVSEQGHLDGVGTDAWLGRFERAVGKDGALVADGSALWLGDPTNHRLRRAVDAEPLPSNPPAAVDQTLRIAPAQTSTMAGNGVSALVNGRGESASFVRPTGLTIAGNFAYVLDNHVIRKVDLTTGDVTTFAGSPTRTVCAWSPDPTLVAFGSDGVLVNDGYYLYVVSANTDNSCSTAVVRVSLATGAASPVSCVSAGYRMRIAIGRDGSLYGKEWDSFFQQTTIVRVDPSQCTRTVISTVPSHVGDMAVDDTYVWAIEWTSNKIRRIDHRTGAVQLFTTSLPPNTGFERITSAGAYLYLSERTDLDTWYWPKQPRVWRMEKATGAIVVVAGAPRTGPGLPYAEGIGASAHFAFPDVLTSDGSSLYVLDILNYRLRKLVPAKEPMEQGGPTRPGELFGGGNPAGLYDPCACADPVSVETGNYYENHTDLAIPSRGPDLSWPRTYNAQAAPTAGPLGFGWTHGFAMKIVDDPYAPGVKNVVQENGSQISFTPSGGSWIAPTRVLATLTTNGDGTFTYVRNQREIFDFTGAGKLQRVRDRNGYATTLFYNGTGQLTSIADSAGRALSVTYNGDGRINRVQDQTGRGVSYTYDTAGNLTDVTDVKGGNTHYTYDSGHLVLTVRDQRLGVLTNTYDSARRVLSQRDQLGRTTTFAYTPASTTVTNPRGYTTVYALDDGRISSMTRAAGTASAATWTYGYDPATVGGTSLTYPDGRTSRTTYDSAGNVLTETDPLLRTTTYTYNALGKLLTVTDPTSVTTTNTYDAAGNLLTSSTPLAGTADVQATTYTYGDPSRPGDVTGVTDPSGKVWSHAYDSFGNRTAETDPLGNTVTHAFDVVGRRTATVSPKGNLAGADPVAHRTSYSYDGFGGLTSIVDPLGHETTAEYDAAGNRTRVTDPDGRITRFTFDAGGRLATVTRADTTTLTYGYDANGNRTSETNAANRTTTYTYDALDRVLSTTDPLNRTTSVTYDAAGNRATSTDASGQVASYDYDDNDRLLSTMYSDGQTAAVSYTYDNRGRRTSMTDGTGTTTYQWDSLSRLTSSKNGAGATVGYGWDISDRLTSIAYPGAGTVTRGYDDAGRLASVTDWLANTTTFAYDEDSQRTGVVRPNGTTEVDTFDRAGRITSIAHRLGTTTFASFDYGRDDSGQLTSMTPAGVPQSAETYTYTALKQLKTVNGGAFEHDAANNLTQRSPGMTLAFDVANQLTSSTLAGSVTTYTHDDRGNRTSVTPPAGGSTSLTWNQANRLTAYGSTATYAYDGDGHRMAKTVSGSSKAFVWGISGPLPLLLKDGAESYIYGSTGTPLHRIAADGTVTYVHGDQLGSVRALTDSSGAVVGTFAFDPFGLPTGTTGTVAMPFGFAGEYRDAESGLLQLRARFYDPTTAQFLSRDPLAGFTGAPHAYGDNNPLNRVDPFGLAAGPAPTFTGRSGEFTVHVATESPSPGMSCEDYLAYLRVAGTHAQGKADDRYYAKRAAQQAREQRRAATLAEAAELKKQAEADRRAAERSIVSAMIDDPQFQYVDDVIEVAETAFACVEGAVLATEVWPSPWGAAAGCAMGAAVSISESPPDYLA